MNEGDSFLPAATRGAGRSEFNQLNSLKKI
jgi:hypothetical protein